jgi:hypothetical protein
MPTTPYTCRGEQGWSFRRHLFAHRVFHHGGDAICTVGAKGLPLRDP